SGTLLIKYWFSISDEEQERRFQARIHNPEKRWKLSPMDLESRRLFREYSHAKDDMLRFSDIPEAPWRMIPADDKRRARLNCIAHLLGSFAYEDVMPDAPSLPPRSNGHHHERPPIAEQNFVPIVYWRRRGLHTDQRPSDTICLTRDTTNRLTSSPTRPGTCTAPSFH